MQRNQRFRDHRCGKAVRDGVDEAVVVVAEVGGMGEAIEIKPRPRPEMPLKPSRPANLKWGRSASVILSQMVVLM